MKIKNEKREKFNSIIIKFTPDDDDYVDGSGAGGGGGDGYGYDVIVVGKTVSDGIQMLVHNVIQ